MTDTTIAAPLRRNEFRQSQPQQWQAQWLQAATAAEDTRNSSKKNHQRVTGRATRSKKDDEQPPSSPQASFSISLRLNIAISKGTGHTPTKNPDNPYRIMDHGSTTRDVSPP